MKKMKIFCSLLGIGFLVSCGTLAPLMDREAASKSIDLAKSVESEKFAPEELATAESEFESGEKLIVREKKSKQNKEAKVKYVEASNQAQTAYNKAIGPFVEQMIIKTEEEIEKARSVKADVVKKDLFDRGVSLNDQAREALNNKNYDRSKTTSLEAYDSVRQAYEETIGLKDQADLLAEEYANLLNILKEEKAEAAIPQEYKDTVANYEGIQSRHMEGYYAEVVPLYEEGILAATDLLDVIEEKRLSAMEHLQEAESSINVAKDKVLEADLKE